MSRRRLPRLAHSQVALLPESGPCRAKTRAADCGALPLRQNGRALGAVSSPLGKVVGKELAARSDGIALVKRALLLTQHTCRHTALARDRPGKIRTNRGDGGRDRLRVRHVTRPHLPPLGKSGDSQRQPDSPPFSGSREATFSQRSPLLHGAEYAPRNR